MVRHDRESSCGVPFPGTKLPRERWTRTRVPLPRDGSAFDWARAFGHAGPAASVRRARVVDLGCGNGRFLIASAIARPDVDHVGIELVPQAVKFASLRAGQRGLTNVKIAWGDATRFVRESCAPGSIDEVHLYHPQPYYEPGQRGRRQLTPETLLAIHRALVPRGVFVFQTDNPAYADWARRAVPALFTWREHEGPWPDAPRGRTLREIVATAEGLPVVRAECARLDLEAEEARRRAAGLPSADFDANRPGFRGGRDGRRRRDAGIR